MAFDISGYGIQIRIIASNTFPVGFTVTETADDADPLSFPDLQIKDSAMGNNGDLIGWTKLNPLKPALAVIPNSESDQNLALLLEANRGGRGKISANDEITMNVLYNDGSTATLTGGQIENGAIGISQSSAGRYKTNTYTFSFENIAKTSASIGGVATAGGSI